MKRPSFQFYPGDWSSNPNLKRCSFAEKGVWIEVMCLMHDQPEYGLIRWTLAEIAEAVKCKAAELQALVRKGVMKGDDAQLSEAFVYVPRSGRKDGEPVTLIAIQAGPVWYSSRMVRDEYVRTVRAEMGGNGEAPKGPPKGGLGATKGEGIGGGFGPRGSSSSSSPSGNTSEAKASGGTPPEVDPAELIFGRGVPLLLAADVPEKNARTMLGLMRKTHGDEAVIDALQRCAEAKALEPVAFLQGCLKAPKKAGKHVGFQSKNYREGVTEDGSLA